MQEMWVVLPLSSLSSYLLSLAIHCLYWPSSWRSKEGKGGARPGSRDRAVGVRKEPVQPALYLEATHPAGTGQLPPVRESHLLMALPKSHSRCGCLLYSLPPVQEGVLSSPSGS